MDWIIGYNQTGRIVVSQSWERAIEDFPKEKGITYVRCNGEVDPSLFYCQNKNIIAKAKPTYTFTVEDGSLFISGLEKGTKIFTTENFFDVESPGKFELEFDEVGTYTVEIVDAVKYLDTEKEVVIE